MELILTLVALFLVLWFYIILPADMAKKRGRSQLFWVLISIVFTPFVSILALMFLGSRTRQVLI